MARRRTRNPFNATKPAEWATMSPKLRKAWNRKHWRPEQWKCDLALKREATRLRHRHDGSTRGKGLEQLAEKIAFQRSNPPRDTVQALLAHPAVARLVARSSGSARAKIVAKLEQVAERAQRVRRGQNPRRLRNPRPAYLDAIMNGASALSAGSDALKNLRGYRRESVWRRNPRRNKARWKSKVRREDRKLSTLSRGERRRIDREEMASGFAVNPRLSRGRSTIESNIRALIASGRKARHRR